MDLLLHKYIFKYIYFITVLLREKWHLKTAFTQKIKNINYNSHIYWIYDLFNAYCLKTRITCPNMKSITKSICEVIIMMK